VYEYVIVLPSSLIICLHTQSVHKEIVGDGVGVGVCVFVGVGVCVFVGVGVTLSVMDGVILGVIDGVIEGVTDGVKVGVSVGVGVGVRVDVGVGDGVSPGEQYSIDVISPPGLVLKTVFASVFQSMYQPIGAKFVQFKSV